ncbi:MAG: DUF3486 family protein [Nitrincola lacisaponensis]|uniref:DUF3486 family protein n=1 Tax=Nitrincola lacisaponensis TaxID=267850 RepID=UPI00391981C5
MTKVTRGRRSKIDLLPVPVRKELDEMLRNGKWTQAEILDAINEVIEEHGLPEEQKLSRSGLNRYATEMEQIGKDLRELREQTSALVADLGEAPQGETTKLILEIARTQLFKAMRDQMLNPEESVDIGMLKDAMLAAQRLESTAMNAHKREKEIRQAFAEEAAAAAETVGKAQGLTAESVAQIKQQILGIV